MMLPRYADHVAFRHGHRFVEAAITGIDALGRKPARVVQTALADVIQLRDPGEVVLIVAEAG